MIQDIILSVITITYNNAYGLKKTFDSVRTQKKKYKFEYIVIDGGSSDSTPQILKENSDIIDKCISEKDNGIYDALNKGLLMSSGQWINCMNAGDIFADDTILSDIMNSEYIKVSEFIYSDFIADNGFYKRLIKQDFYKGRVLHQSLVYKRQLHYKYGNYCITHPYIVSDYLFFAQIPASLVAKFDRPISINDTHGVSMSSIKTEYQRRCVDYMLKRTTAIQLLFGIMYCLLVDFVKLIIPIKR